MTDTKQLIDEELKHISDGNGEDTPTTIDYFISATDTKKVYPRVS